MTAEEARTEPPGASRTPAELSRLLRDIAHHLDVTENLEDSLLRLMHVTRQMIPGCDLASVTLLDDGRLVTAAATDPLARRLDELQYEEGEGPCVETAGRDQWIYTTSLADDHRWPRFSRRVLDEFELSSMLACQLGRFDRQEDRTGAVNLYSRKPDAFSEADWMIALLVGAHAGVLVDAAQQKASLRRALESRDVIGQAKGILMAHNGISQQEAFDKLVEVSQRFNIKLRDVARMISESKDERVISLEPSRERGSLATSEPESTATPPTAGPPGPTPDQV